MARVKAVLRRSSNSIEDYLVFGELEIKELSRSVSISGKILSLTPKEYDLLVYLSKNNRIVLD